jgi:hypothetical protein
MKMNANLHTQTGDGHMAPEGTVYRDRGGGRPRGGGRISEDEEVAGDLGQVEGSTIAGLTALIVVVDTTRPNAVLSERIKTSLSCAARGSSVASSAGTDAGSNRKVTNGTRDFINGTI